LLQPMFDAEFDRGFAMAMKQNPQLTADKAEQGRAVARAFTGIIIPVFGLIVPMVAGVMLWLLGKAVGARQELGAACMVAVYAFFPRLAEGLLNLLQAAVLPAENLTSHFAIQLGPARFLDPDGSSLVLITLLGRLDLITIWCTALLALGLSVTGKISLNKAAIAAGGVWLLGTLLQLIGPLRAATQ
ncbi:MAG: YIP1 family protein, partial [Gemmatimonadota bacterium]